MLIGYARVSKADGSQSLDLQRCAMRSRSVPTSLRKSLTSPRSGQAHSAYTSLATTNSGWSDVREKE